MQHAFPQKLFRRLTLFRFVISNLFIILLEYAGFLMENIANHFIPFAIGSAYGFMFLRGMSIIPGIFSGFFVGYWVETHHLQLSLLFSLVFSIQVLLSYQISQAAISETMLFRDSLSLCKFILIILVMAVSFSQLTHTAFAPYINSVAIVGFPLIAWDMYFPEVEQLKLKLFIMLGLLIFITFIAIKLSSYLILLLLVMTSLLIRDWFYGVMLILLVGLSLSAKTILLNTPETLPQSLLLIAILMSLFASLKPIAKI